MEKIYISGDELVLDSFKLAARIHHSGFRPDLIVGVWRGGTPIAVAVQEYFEYMGLGADHIAIRATSYSGIARRHAEVRIHGLEYIAENRRAHHNLLIVDDVFDTGRSAQAICEAIRAEAGEKAPLAVIKTAMPWYKPGNNRTGTAPDYCLHTTDKWLVFPHELCGLSREEIQQNKAAIAQTLFPEAE